MLDESFYEHLADYDAMVLPMPELADPKRLHKHVRDAEGFERWYVQTYAEFEQMVTAVEWWKWMTGQVCPAFFVRYDGEFHHLMLGITRRVAPQVVQLPRQLALALDAPIHGDAA